MGSVSKIRVVGRGWVVKVAGGGCVRWDEHVEL